MKKTIILISSLFLILSLIGCNSKTTVVIPDFFGMEYGDVLKWSFDNDINLDVSSEYNDDVIPNTVFYQSVDAGVKVEIESNISIKYSRGYSLDGVIVVPDFSDSSRTEIQAWIDEMDLGKYQFLDSFDLSLEEGQYVGYEVNQLIDGDEYLRRDEFIFFLSKGSLVVENIAFSDFTIHGVNLGGWFVLEGWMTPDLFNGVNGSDETVFMEQKENAVEVIEEHWETFVVEEDFIWLKEHGVEYVRLPIPWWLFGEGVYHSSVLYIEQAMLWAEEHDIKVLLDLHTAPGCQNGFDNGGISGVLEWPEADNVAKTVEILGDIAEHFSMFDSLWGIEVLNEPGWSVNMTILQNFYLDAYDIIRYHNSNVYVGFHDGFRNYDNTWIRFFENNDFNRVFFDMHLYQTFGDGWGDFDIFDHVAFVHEEQRNSIARYTRIVPVVIGEWSLGLQGNVYEGLNQESIKSLKMAFANAQFNEYDKTFGWFFWNYKIDASSHLEWDFRRLVEAEIFPEIF